MRKSYKSAMDRLTVSDALRQRVLAAAEEKERAVHGFVPRRWVKPVCGAAACLALMGAAGVWMNLSGIDTANLSQKAASSSAATSSTEAAGFAETADSASAESRKQNEAAGEATMEACLTGEEGAAENDAEDTKGSDASDAATFTALPIAGDGENALTGEISSQSGETDGDTENGSSGRMESADSSDGSEASGKTSEAGDGSEREEVPYMVGIPNPVLSCETREEAAGLLGFSPLIPESVPSDAEISVIAGSLLQLCWEQDGVSFVYRTAEGSDDISGDWNSYETSETVEVAGLAVTLKGSGGLVSLMLWTENGQSFSLSADPGTEWKKLKTLLGFAD
ncbi:MAG: hypothetical protein PUC47_10930 [Oscillospiraceae bacterium]|nr:hypothetical protein [Oscillospiraceae bacterium]